ncbi:MAG: endonuclease/exonuclease/phosphatase family protein [Bacteroidales bacterium]|nr:endonuclease/exonuclease/phosphatase family protein [Bacteroidales bacterium]
MGSTSGMAQEEGSIAVMTYNIRYNNPTDGEHAWPDRKQLVFDVIKRHNPDLIGIQEALHGQVKDLESALPEYGWIGVGREDGKKAGEYSPVFYRKSRFTVLSDSTFWLSKSPKVPGSISWGACCTRIVTLVEFHDRSTGDTLYHLNTHFDQRSELAKAKSAEIINKTLEELDPENYVLTGDLNCIQSSKPYRILTGKEGKLYDSHELATQSKGPDYTFTGFEGKAKAGHIIDYIMVSPGINVLEQHIIPHADEKNQASDHLPVMANIIY